VAVPDRVLTPRAHVRPRPVARRRTRRGVTVVVTTIASPTPALARLASLAASAGWRLVVVGDRKTPEDFSLADARYLDLGAQAAWRLAEALPLDHYARKNAGYLDAIAGGARVVAETDDDNEPYETFFAPAAATVAARVVRKLGWVNVYRLFSEQLVWPRGFPLDRVREAPAGPDGPLERVRCPIQQGLADGDPDVDAVYRLVVGEPVVFERRPPVALAPGALCPTNSQNTFWWPEAFPLLYLPSHCSFRMTDIWRGLVAARVAAAQGWHVLFRTATVHQDRNEHDLLRDLAGEVDGYLRNGEIADLLAATPVEGSPADGLVDCYRALVEAGVLPAAELGLVDLWLADLAEATHG
jgi:hypothetical protein